MKRTEPPAASTPSPSKRNKTSNDLPFSGMSICVSGQMSCNRTGFHKRLTDYGAQVVTGISNKTSHLITTHVEANNPTGKVLAAMNKNVSCVSEAWVNDSITSGMALDVSEYLLIDTNLQGGSSASETKNSDINNNTRSIVANARNAGTVIKVRANQLSTN
mmetsp:Transcript_10709/g.13073  ORF Transcript_10709/g.13073 Transcript_10709/m.13073 type:complete len:161 (-) Transcript_10709:42-524(-)